MKLGEPVNDWVKYEHGEWKRDGRFIRIRTKEPTITFPSGIAVKQSTIRSMSFDGFTSCEAEVVGWEPVEICNAYLERRDDGQYVEASAYDALEARIAELEAALKQIASAPTWRALTMSGTTIQHTYALATVDRASEVLAKKEVKE